MGQGSLRVHGGVRSWRLLPWGSTAVVVLRDPPVLWTFPSSPGFPRLSPSPGRKSPKLSGGHWTKYFKLLIIPCHLLILSERLRVRAPCTSTPPHPSLAPRFSSSLSAGTLLLDAPSPPPRTLTSSSGTALSPPPLPAPQIPRKPLALRTEYMCLLIVLFCLGGFWDAKRA